MWEWIRRVKELSPANERKEDRQTTDVGSALGRFMRRNARARRTNLAGAWFPLLIQHPAMAMMMSGQVDFFSMRVHSWLGFVYQQQAVIIYQLDRPRASDLSSTRSSWWSTCWWSPPSHHACSSCVFCYSTWKFRRTWVITNNRFFREIAEQRKILMWIRISPHLQIKWITRKLSELLMRYIINQ